MPPKEKSKNRKSGDRNKRKNISPLFEDSKVSSNQDRPPFKTGSNKKENVNKQNVNKQSTPDNQSKRFHYSSSSPPQYFVFDTPSSNCNNGQINMNNMNNNPFPPLQYAGQFGQSPQSQCNSQFMSPNPYTQPPQWAESVMADLKSIKANVSKIESIEKTVTSINYKLSDLEKKVTNIDKRVGDVEAASQFISTKFDQQKGDLETAKADMKMLKDSCENLKSNLETLELKHTQMKSKVSDCEYRSMRDNLIFYGIKRQHSQPNSMEQEPENCEDLVKNFIGNHLKIDASNILFDRAHRLGNSLSKSTLPIVVKFHYYQDREKIRNAATQLRDELKQNNYGVGVQLPKEWRESRKSLYPVMQAERRKGNNTRFIGEKLFVNGQEYKSNPTGSG